MMEDPRYIHTTSDRQNKPEKLNKLGHSNKICLLIFQVSIINLTTNTQLVLNVYYLHLLNQLDSLMINHHVFSPVDEPLKVAAAADSSQASVEVKFSSRGPMPL